MRIKKIAVVALGLMVSVGAHAQFESGKQYCGASLTGLNLSYNGSEELSLGIQAKAGYFFEDDMMLLAQAEYKHSGLEGVKDYWALGAQGRYYIEQNGIYLGAGMKLIHTGSYNDVMPGVEVGYAFFVSKQVTIEPAVYYDQSFKNHSDYSTVGVKVGIGIYL
ncbi:MULTISPECIES: outer membrane beta-barrel protein [Prevotellaceae]|jgi:hypothetical protein|uniref:outer membrane beta-barrel protein n=1 Tax=Prevotellaceae TaxID=171552 RepID=UPI001C38B742|nr:outer membrane beta-barrel protein [Segatella copri]MBV3401825.1 outer membrane beta-barrel protein [Segatella copri]MBW0048809.1 outer membrane beta-barrel protein [Segatella copri]MDY5672039.1 outer membrane beta-barrel protein [Prevotella sp.]